MGAGRWDSDPLHVCPSRQETRQVACQERTKKELSKEEGACGRSWN